MAAPDMTPDYATVIVGAGFAGIGAAIKLDKSGMGDYLVIEAADGPGGTWHWNTYPGIAVDIPSFSYQFSFEQSCDWSRTYARGRELKAYAEHCVEKYNLRPKMRLHTKVLDAAFDDEMDMWRIATDAGDVITARFLVNAGDVLTTPKLPDIDGVDSFPGPTMHTARWDHDLNLVGKRVAIIGTGASALQVIPEIAPIVEHLTVFQRTPIWCFPRADIPLSPTARRVMRIPGGKAVQRLISQTYVELAFPLIAQYYTVNPTAKRMSEAGKAYLRRQVMDPVVRDKLTPRYAVGCKRPGFHNTYLSAFNRDNVTLVTEPIDKITGSRVATTDGECHDVDVLILATGFKVTDPENVLTYSGVSIPGFPNFFTVFGPYGYVGSSYFALIESQTHHIVPVPRARSAPRCHQDRGDPGRQRPLLRRDDAQAAPPDLLAGELLAGQQLLLRQERRRAPAARHHVGGVLAQPPVPARRLRIQRLTRQPAGRRNEVRRQTIPMV